MNESAVKEAPLREGALWPALREYWHVVAWSDEVKEGTIFPFTLLDEDIVVCRVGGELAAFSDLCIHRGTPISLGYIERDRIVCCYHGWEYNCEGQCTRIPAIPDDHPIPKRARLTRYQVQERYGMVWVCMSDTPRMPVPDCPLAEEPDYHVIYRKKWVWETTAARATENFFDQAHFAFIHRGILGDPSEPRVSEPTFQRDQEVLHFQVEVPANKTIPVAHVRNYSVFRPFTIYQRKEQPDGQNQVFLNYSCPTSAKESARFLTIYQNHEAEVEEGSRVEDLQDLIHEQDRIIVERQRPEMLPLDLSEELHVKGPDSIAVAYRRFMKELGVEP